MGYKGDSSVQRIPKMTHMTNRTCLKTKRPAHSIDTPTIIWTSTRPNTEEPYKRFMGCNIGQPYGSLACVGFIIEKDDGWHTGGLRRSFEIDGPSFPDRLHRLRLWRLVKPIHLGKRQRQFLITLIMISNCEP